MVANLVRMEVNVRMVLMVIFVYVAQNGLVLTVRLVSLKLLVTLSFTDELVEVVMQNHNLYYNKHSAS